MIEIEQLRYVRLGTRNLPAAIDFAQRILGLQLIDKTDDQASFRSDFRDHTLVYVNGDPADQTVAFEVRTPEMLDHAAAALAGAGLTVTRGDADAAAARKVRQFISFRDHSGNTIELVVRPLNTGWRYFPSRDAGITGLDAVALRNTANGADETLWTSLFNGRISDWAGDTAYIRFDAAHHRLTLHPSDRKGILAVEYAVEGVNQLMQSMYVLQAAQVKIVHGPGRRPTSNQMFLTFAGPDGVLFSYVAEGDAIADETAHRPRQFPFKPLSFCAWGSDSEIPEFAAGADR
ncbi:MAG TPA: VOC family protein [Pseudolabrys sp.]|nr:VOC family protein [Pseudolabrys sp.]